jgi:arylsulfatase A-like enzyme
MSEEVLSIPFAMRWPGAIRPGQVSRHLVSSVDLPVTLLDAAGTSFTGLVDGSSLLDVALKGRAETGAQTWREDIMCETHGHHREPVVGRTIITQRHYYTAYKFHEVPHYLTKFNPPEESSELYDLQEDPYQLDNLAEDPAHQEIVGDLQRRLERWQERTGDPVAL